VSEPSKLFFLNSVDRRLFLAGSAFFGAGLLYATAGLAQGRIGEVAVNKLMAKDDLPELSIGNENAPVTIVEYMSMSCPACATFHKTTFPELKKKYIDTGKVRFVIREFPLNHLAAAGAMLARCAGDNDKSIAMIDVLFAKQRDWVSNRSVEELSKIAKQAGFTQERFEKCLNDGELLAKLSRRRERADKEFGVEATPSFFINGKWLRTRVFNLDAFEKVIEPLLKAS